jgi:hypothetical protein
MAGGSATEAWCRATARILISVGLTGSICALIGYCRVKGTPKVPSISAMPAPTRMVPSPTVQYNAVFVHTPSRPTRSIAKPWSSPTELYTAMPVLSRALTTRPTHTLLPPVEPTSSAIVPSSKQPTSQEGALAPDFTLPNAQGGSFTLSDLRNQRGVVLVFYRTTG